MCTRNYNLLPPWVNEGHSGIQTTVPCQQSCNQQTFPQTCVRTGPPPVLMSSGELVQLSQNDLVNKSPQFFKTVDDPASALKNFVERPWNVTNTSTPQTTAPPPPQTFVRTNPPPSQTFVRANPPSSQTCTRTRPPPTPKSHDELVQLSQNDWDPAFALKNFVEHSRNVPNKVPKSHDDPASALKNFVEHSGNVTNTPPQGDLQIPPFLPPRAQRVDAVPFNQGNIFFQPAQQNLQQNIFFQPPTSQGLQTFTPPTSQGLQTFTPPTSQGWPTFQPSPQGGYRGNGKGNSSQTVRKDSKGNSSQTVRKDSKGNSSQTVRKDSKGNSSQTVRKDSKGNSSQTVRKDSRKPRRGHDNSSLQQQRAEMEQIKKEKAALEAEVLRLRAQIYHNDPQGDVFDQPLDQRPWADIQDDGN